MGKKVKVIKRVRAPVRLDFGGGTTDIKLFTLKHVGAVLNAGISPHIYGKLMADRDDVGLEYHGEVPTSSGLGTSGVMNLVWLSLISKTKDKKELADRVYGLEQSMGLVGGKQDQYAGAFGGINFLEFKGDKVKFEQLKLPRKFVKKLESNLVLVYTGKPHFSGDSNKRMMDNLRKGKNTDSLLRIRDIAREMKNALLKKDLYLFENLLNHETKQRRKLHWSIVPKHVDKFIKKGFENGAGAAKVCGSGGGGMFVVFWR